MSRNQLAGETEAESARSEPARAVRGLSPRAHTDKCHLWLCSKEQARLLEIERKHPELISNGEFWGQPFPEQHSEHLSQVSARKERN